MKTGCEGWSSFVYLQTGSNKLEVTEKIVELHKSKELPHRLSKNQLLNEKSVSLRHKAIIAKRSSSLYPTTYRLPCTVDKGQK